ncbi:MAG: hypothetical protein ACRECP_11955 [Methylocella sp.]
MIDACAKQVGAVKREAFIPKWRLKCRAIADRLERAGDKLRTFTRAAKSRRKSIRMLNAIGVRQAHQEGLHKEFGRRIKTQIV